MDKVQKKAALKLGGIVLGTGLIWWGIAKMARAGGGVIPPGPTGLQYVSPVRASNGQGCTSGGIYFEVDVKNNSTQVQTCSPIAYIQNSVETVAVPMGTLPIFPGQAVTFTGNWCWNYGAPEPVDYWRGQYIESEAGVISFEYGRSVYLVSYSIPAQIPSGGEFWAEQTVHLAYRNDWIYSSYLQLVEHSPADPYRMKIALASSRRFGGNAYGYTEEGMVPLTATKDYTARGGMKRINGVLVESPAIASYPYANPSNLVPLPPGLYDVAHSLVRWQIVGADEIGNEAILWLRTKVGQVMIV